MVPEGTSMKRRSGLAFLLSLVLGCGSGTSAQDAEGPGKLELRGAEHRLEEFEDRVRRAGGKPFRLTHIEEEALRRIKALQVEYPDDPKVLELHERARRALLGSKGEFVDVTEEMLAYRRTAEILREKFAGVAAEELEELEAQIAVEQGGPLAAFPCDNPLQSDMSEFEGKWVLLEDFAYPRNEFSHQGEQFVFVGKPSTGFYYVDISTRAWAGAYEALRRYRREIGGMLPEELLWRVYGKITGITLQVPQAGEEKSLRAEWGWRVEPLAIHVPGCTLTLHDPDLEVGGLFAGEPRLEEIKGPLYSVTEVPEDAAPEQVIDVYVTAIKEKNHDLFLDCIDPARKVTPAALERANYHWALHQGRWLRDYVTAAIGEPEITVLRGYDGNNELEEFFLTEEERAELRAYAGPTVEEARVWLRMFNDRGKQVGKPRPFTLRRYELERWYVEDPSAPN